MLKVSLILNNKSLKSFLISLIRAKFIYFIRLSLLSNIKVINLLLKIFNLISQFLNIKAIIIINIKKDRSLKYYYILILYN